MRCRCILKDPQGKHKCGADATPDSPFCPTCESRHPEMGGSKVEVLVDTAPVSEWRRDERTKQGDR